MLLYATASTSRIAAPGKSSNNAFRCQCNWINNTDIVCTVFHMDCWSKQTKKQKRNKILCEIHKKKKYVVKKTGQNKNVDLARMWWFGCTVLDFLFLYVRSLIFSRCHRFFIKRIMLKLYLSWSDFHFIYFFFLILSLSCELIPMHWWSKSEQCFALHLTSSIFCTVISMLLIKHLRWLLLLCLIHFDILYRNRRSTV